MTISAADAAFNEIVFGYQPNKALCIAAIVIFAVLCIGITIQNTRTKAWYMFVVTVTALTEIGGYIARYFMADIKPGRNAFIAMDVLLILSPNALALVNYWTVGLIVQRVANGGKIEGALSWVNPKTISGLFLTSDFIAFAIQGAAAGLLTGTDPHNQKTGQSVMLAGLAVQMAFFTLFAFITIYVHSVPSFNLRHNKHVRPAFYALYITIILLTLRSIYRFMEFADQGGYVARHEVFFYVFDTLVVIGGMTTYIILPFGKYLNFDIEVDRVRVAEMKRKSSEV